MAEKFWTAEVEVHCTFRVELAPDESYDSEEELEDALQNGAFEDEINYAAQFAAWDDCDLRLLSAESDYDEEEDEEDEETSQFGLDNKVSM